MVVAVVCMYSECLNYSSTNSYDACVLIQKSVPASGFATESHVFSNYGPGLRAILFSDGGKVMLFFFD